MNKTHVKKYLVFNIFMFALTTFAIVFLQNYWYLILEFLYASWIIYYYGADILLFLSLALVPVTFFSIYNFSQENLNNEHTARVEKIYSTSLVVSIDNQNYYVMFEEQLENITLGAEIYFTCSFVELSETDSFAVFVKSNKTEYYCYATEYQIVEQGRNTYRNDMYYQTINGDSLYYQFFKYMIYGYVDEQNQWLDDSVVSLGIVALFVISGAQITIIITVFNKILKFIIRNKTVSYVLSSIVSFMFIWLTFMPPPSTRAWLNSNFSFINKQSKIVFARNDILGFTGLVFLFVNPFLLLTPGVILSFSIMFFINLISGYKFNYLPKLILTSSLAFVVSIPIIATFNSSFNLTSPLMNVIFEPIISFTYIVIIFTMPFEVMHSWFDWLFIILQNALLYFNSWVFTIEVDAWKWIYVLINYWILFECTRSLDKHPLLLTTLCWISLSIFVTW